jgi:glycosyltransferase
MKFSIITATFNSSATIAGCVESVNNQTYSLVEHIIIDGGSKDGTVERIQSLSNRVARLVSEPDQGIYDALNKGINLATGDIIGILHSDDVFADDNTLSDIHRMFQAPQFAAGGERVDIVYGDLVFVSETDPNKVVRVWKSRPFKKSLLNWGWMPPHPTVFIRKEIYQKLGFFCEGLKCSADYELMLRLLRDENIRVRYFPQVVTKMRIGGTSTGGLPNLIRKMREDLRVLNGAKLRFPLSVLIFKNIRKLRQIIIHNPTKPND